MAIADPPALNPEEATLGLNNGPGLWIAPAGTPGPADLVSEWAAPWRPLGYVSEDGVTLSPDVSSDTITPWQSTSPIRQVITSKAITLGFQLLQTNLLTLALYFDVAEPEPQPDGTYSFAVRSDEGGYVHALGLDIKDGDQIERFVWPRAQISDNDDVTVSRGEVMSWGVTFGALDDNGVLAYVQGGSISGEAESHGGPAPIAPASAPVTPASSPIKPAASKD